MIKSVLFFFICLLELHSLTFHLHKGWQLLGTSEDINMSVFDKKEIYSVYSYDTQKGWSIFVPNRPDISDILSFGYKPLDFLEKNRGFWVNCDSDIDINDSSTDSNKIFFQKEDSQNIQNPDRGFYVADYDLIYNYNYNPYSIAKEHRYNLIFGVIDLKDYKESYTLPDSLIQKLRNNLELAKQAGVKIILRIRYRGERSYDPKKDIIISHLEQLKTIFKEYMDTFTAVEMGLIGEYGEWHNFTGDFSETTSNYKDNMRAIIEKTSEIFPNLYLQLRTPMFKEFLYGSSNYYADLSDSAKITPQIAFKDEIISKIGQYNDCFLSSDDDSGTYAENDTEFWKEYVANDTLYSVNGGEMCYNNPVYTNCNSAVEQMQRFHYSFLNETSFDNIFQNWKDEGCYEYIKRNLGYNISANWADIKIENDILKVYIYLTNYGFAAPHFNYKISFILKNDENFYQFFQTDTQLKALFPSTTMLIKKDIDLNSINKGVYSLYLKIGEDNATIRLSNKDIWDEKLLANKLKEDLSIDNNR